MVKSQKNNPKNLIVIEKKFKRQPNINSLSEQEKNFYYIINVGHHENYDNAMKIIAKNLTDLEESKQLAAIQALDILSCRFHDIEDTLVLPQLFKNLKNSNQRIKSQSIDTLTSISHLIPRLKQKIYLTFFTNGVDFFTGEELKIFTNKDMIHTLNNEQEKKEFILSVCQNSINYEEALDVCFYFLKNEDDKEVNISALQGLTYIVIRFQKVNFQMLLPFIMRYLSLEDSRYIYAESLLADIAIMIPKLRENVVKILKDINSGYCKLYKFE